MPIAIVNNAELYYEIHGKGMPLVFITGFSSDHTIWRNIVEYYAKFYQVILFDNRGCGRSEAPDFAYTIEMLAEDTAGLCKTLNIQSAYFIGLSMGGMILQTLARKYPSLVRAAVLNNTMMEIDVRFMLYCEAKAELIQNNASPMVLAKLSLPWGLSSRYLSQPGIIEGLIELSNNNPYPISEIGFRNQLNAIKTFNSEAWLHEINVPCLVIGTDEDAIVNEAHTEQMAKIIPNAQYYKIKNAGHLPHIEQTEEFNQVVGRFLSKINTREILV